MPVGSVPPVSGDFPGSAGTGPDEPDPGVSSPQGEPPDPDQLPLRGWISPDDRLWRHPSEIGTAARRPSPVGGGRRARSGPLWIAGGTAVCLVGLLFVSGLVMIGSGTAPGGTAPGAPSAATLSAGSPPTTEIGTARLTGVTSMEHAVSGLQPSLVALTVTRPKGTGQATGVTVASGGIVVTAASALAGASSVSAVEPDGTRETAQVVGTDPTSGVAVVKVASDLPAASFATGDPAPGATAMAVALTSPAKRGHVPQTAVYAGTVRSSGTAVGADPATTVFAATAVDTPLAPTDAGCPLVDSAGQVAGILETTETMGGTTVAVFLPAALAYGVAYQLITSGNVVQGWLGIDASNQVQGSGRSPTGAVVDSVDPGGAAALAGLQAGDQIMAVDGGPVHSVAELRSRLYPFPPGTEVSITFLRGGTVGTTQAVLGTAAPAATAAPSSP